MQKQALGGNHIALGFGEQCKTQPRFGKQRIQVSGGAVLRCGIVTAKLHLHAERDVDGSIPRGKAYRSAERLDCILFVCQIGRSVGN
jgi:hypothetical protein